MSQTVDRIGPSVRVNPIEPSLEQRYPVKEDRLSAPTPQIIALPELQDGSQGGIHPEVHGAVLRDWSPLHHVKAHLQVCVGQAVVTVGELLSAKENQILRLDRQVNQAVDLTVEGKVVARGQLVAVDGYFAVRITELPVVLDLTHGG